MARMRATGGSPGGAAALVTVCWIALALKLCATPTRAQDVLSDAAREVATCGSCTWFVVRGSPGALVKNGTCEADCSGNLNFYNEGIGTISEGAFAGLPLVVGLSLSDNNLQHVPAQAFSRLPILRELNLMLNNLQRVPAQAFSHLPRLQALDLNDNPLVGLVPGTFANNAALGWLNVGGTALACVPADGIPDTATISGAVRCPAGCEVGTVYDAAMDACVACPAGLQPVVPGTVGGGLGTCVPAGWDAVFLAFCGSCAFWRTAATNVLVRTGSCEADCSGMLDFSDMMFTNPLIKTISEGAFAGLPMLTGIYLYGNPLAGLEPGTFANNTALQNLDVSGTALACVPADGIPDTATINGAVRCPAGCEVGTVYDAAADACVACPAGLQPVAPGTVGGALGTCVPAGWDAVWLAFCGSCAFWRTAATNVLVRTGSCEADCSGFLYLHDRGIAAVAPGAFANLTGLEGLYIYDNPLGCVPGVLDSVEIDIHSWQAEKTPRCPADCAVGTFFVQPSNACPTAGDGICDEPVWCEAGTDCADCQDVLGYATCDGSAGVCLPCPAGLTTAGVGAESCVDPAALASGETTSSSAVATTPAPTTSSSSSSTPPPTTSSSSSSTAATTSSSSPSTPLPTTSSSSSSTPPPTTSSSSSSTPPRTTSSSSSSTAATTSSSSPSTPLPTTSSSSSSTPLPTTSSSSSSTPAPTPFPSPCAGGARLFVVAGIALCVPDRFFPAPVVHDCVLEKTWEQLRELGRVFTTGGLGREMVAGEFEVWVCTRHSSCGSTAGAVCFTFREGLEVFVPWGLESELNFMQGRR